MAIQSDRKSPVTTREILIISGGLIVSSMLIAFAARGDLWLDEIWSIFFAEAARSPFEIVTKYRHDNNHLLNTLYMYAVGRDAPLYQYRLLAVASGILSLIIIVLVPLRSSFLESLIGLLCAGVSYPLINYFSEARGYAPAMLFGILSFYIVQRSSAMVSARSAVLFSLTAILGVVSHFSYIIVFTSLSFLIVYSQLNGHATGYEKTKNVMGFLSIPAAFILGYYLYFIRNMTIGGGPVYDKLDEISRGMAYLFGLPQELAAIGLPLYLLIVAAGVYLYASERNGIWVFYVSVLLVSPILVILTAKPTYFYFRYVVICVPFLYLLAAKVLVKMYCTPHGAVKMAVIAVLSLYLLGQGQYLLTLYRYGRGGYSSVLKEIYGNSSSSKMKVGSDQDFRAKIIITFYQRFLPKDRTLVNVDRDAMQVDPPEWIITHGNNYPDTLIQISDRNAYRLVKSEMSSELSGFNWFLYRAAN